ncbi:MAG: nucleotide sugar dehydrogenase [Elusimicrobia bacterium HGW-Elusimicrobia-1]|jgi:UDP-N-acetyl-D-glucosamine dehydrogenase|nr:MAG: nucleotide sugar dehydrogenase [Elusimicrobia bacterium HGW-Elusimicrobia-1]
MNIVEKIKSGKAKVAVIGLGYVGLPLVREFLSAGFNVTGLDIDVEKIRMLKAGKSYIKHFDSSIVKKWRALGRFHPTVDFAALKAADAIVICVPTPLGAHHEPDLSYVLDTTTAVAKYLKRGQLVVLESTTYPGTTDEDMRSILEKTGLKAGKDFHLAFSPEREDPNNKNFTTRTIPKVVGGYTAACLKAAKALYDSIVETTVPVSSTKAAEAAKLLENIYRAVNIALVNELKMLFDKMDVDVWEVIKAAATKPFGFQAFYPGPGLGGHCIPIDPFYLTWKAREYGFATRFIELAGEINTKMPDYVVGKTIEALNAQGKSIAGAKILILGLAYKKDIDDVRESPSFKVMELLEEKKARVDYNDPYAPKTPRMRKYSFVKKSVKLSAAALGRYDCVIVLTDHTVYDGDFIARHSRLVVDSRNLVKNRKRWGSKVVQA